MIRRLIVPLTAAVVTVHAGHVFAQGAFPAPLPNQSAAPANASPFPPVHGAAPSDEACKLIKNFGQAELKMISYVQTNSAKCGIPPQIADQLKNGHKNTEGMQKKVCAVAQQQQQKGPAGPSLSEVLGSSASLPEATATRKGGSTFDTLNGNVLAR